MTKALEGGEWSAARPSRTLPPGKTRYPFYRRQGGPQGRSERAKNLVPSGSRSRTVQPVVSRYTDWATRPINKVKVKWSRYRPGVAQKVGRGIALLFRDRGTRRATNKVQLLLLNSCHNEWVFLYLNSFRFLARLPQDLWDSDKWYCGVFHSEWPQKKVLNLWRNHETRCVYTFVQRLCQ
jgi:hypothetical protein